jgi:hypothetical protein
MFEKSRLVGALRPSPGRPRLAFDTCQQLFGDGFSLNDGSDIHGAVAAQVKQAAVAAFKRCYPLGQIVVLALERLVLVLEQRHRRCVAARRLAERPLKKITQPLGMKTALVIALAVAAPPRRALPVALPARLP